MLQVHFEQIPTVATLQSMIPTGAAAVSPKPFTPPAPAFHPAKTVAPSENMGAAPTEGEESPAPQSDAPTLVTPVPTAAPRQYF